MSKIGSSNSMRYNPPDTDKQEPTYKLPLTADQKEKALADLLTRNANTAKGVANGPKVDGGGSSAPTPVQQKVSTPFHPFPDVFSKK